MVTANVETSAQRWRKSSYSNGSGGNCVEVGGPRASSRLVRDSKRPSGPVLDVDAGAWGAFVAGLSAEVGG